MEEDNGQFLINDFVPDSEKATEEYGVKLMNKFWTRLGGWNFYNDRVVKYDEITSFCEGNYSVQQLIDQTTSRQSGGQPNTSWANLDYSPPAILPVFIDGMVGSFMSRKYKTSCKSADGLARTSKLDEKNKQLNLLTFKKEVAQVDKLSGIPTPKAKYETEEEIDIEHENFKLSYEEAVEVAVQNVLEQCNIESEERKMWYDLIKFKMVVVRCYYDINWVTKFERIDPKMYLSTLALKEDFSDVNCEGHLELMTIGELKRQSGYDNQKLYEIACKFTGNLGNAKTIVPFEFGLNESQYVWFDNKIMVFHYRFKSIETATWKEKKNRYGKTRIYKGQAKKDTESTIAKDIENLYEGNWIVGSEYSYKHRKCANMVRKRLENAFSTQTQTGYFKFAPNLNNGTNVSHAERAIMFVRQWHLAFLKLQQFLAAAIPPGYKIDTYGLQAVDLGSGKTDFDPLEMRIMHKETGVYIYDSGGEGGLGNGNKSPLENFIVPIGEIDKLWASCNFFLECIRQVCGRPVGIDTSTPNPETLVGVLNATGRAADYALMPLRQAFTNVMKGAANYLCMMIQDKATSGQSEAIGDLNVDLLEMAEDIENATLGIDIEYEPDDQERAEMRMTLDFEVKNGGITSEDALYIKSLPNVNQMARVMKVRREQKRKKDMEFAAFNSREQSLGSAEAAKVAEQARMQTEIAIVEAKKQLITAETEQKLILMKEQAKIDEAQAYNLHTYKLSEQQAKPITNNA